MEFNKKNIRIILLLAAAVILMYQLLDNLSIVLHVLGQCLHVVYPFVLGLAIAFILNVPMRSFERRIARHRGEESLVYRKKRLISFLFTILAMIGIIFLVAFLVVPQITETISQIVDLMPTFTKNVAKWLQSMQTKIPQLKEAIGNLEAGWDVVESALNKIEGRQIAGMFSSTVGLISGVINGFVTFFIAFVFACYVLFHKETLSEQTKKAVYALLPLKAADRVLWLARMADHTFTRFLVGQCTEALILGLMFIVTMGVLRLPYNLMLGILIGVLSLIPIVGAFIGCFVGAFLILMVDPMKALVFVIVFLVLQQIEENFIYPHVVGNSVGLPSLWVLMAVTLGGNLMGVAGMIIGIPVVSISYTLFAKYVHVRLMTKQVAEYKWKNHPADALGKQKKNMRKKHEKRTGK